jgi:hypothetical protein
MQLTRTREPSAAPHRQKFIAVISRIHVLV